MNAILVTGAAGYLGGHIIETINRDQPHRKIIAVDNLTNHNDSVLNWIKNKRNITFIKSDIGDVKTLENVFFPLLKTFLCNFQSFFMIFHFAFLVR